MKCMLLSILNKSVMSDQLHGQLVSLNIHCTELNFMARNKNLVVYCQICLKFMFKLK